MATIRKRSRKRDAILACVRATTCHPSAEWVISVGTVGGLERFDGNTKPHTHFVCTRCSAVLDLMDINLEDEFLQNVHSTAGSVITDYRLSFYGLCPDCMQAEASAE